MRDLVKGFFWSNQISSIGRFLAGLILLAISAYYYSENTRALKFAQINFESQQIINRDADEQKLVFEANYSRFTELQKHGYIGAPKRLQWVEALRNEGRINKVPDINFSLENSKKLIEGEDNYWHREIGITATDMRVTMDFAHEGDLYSMLNGLAESADGLYSVDKCNLFWQTRADEYNQFSRLRTDCWLKFYTVVDVTKEWEGSGF